MGVFGLQLHRVTVDLGRMSMQVRLITERLGPLGIGGLLGLALRLALVGKGPRLAFAGPLLPRASRSDLVGIIHT